MDQLREDTQERTWEDYVDTASAALAGIAGAALFLRKGGYRKLTKATRFLDAFENNLSNNFLDNPISSFESIGSTLKHNYSEAYHRAMKDVAANEGTLSSMQNGVIGQLFNAIQFAENGISAKRLKQDILSGKRFKFAKSIATAIQEHSLQNDQDNALTELESSVLDRTLLKMTRANTPLDDTDIQKMISESIEDEDSFKKVLKHAEAIQEELKKNSVNIDDSSTVSWKLSQREFQGFNPDGTAKFGNVVSTEDIDFNKIGDAFREKLTDWQEYVDNQRKDNGWYASFIDDVKGRRATIGDIMNAEENGDPNIAKFFDPNKAWATPIQNATGAQAPSINKNPLEYLKEYRAKMSQEERDIFDQIRVDEIRIQNGQFYATNAIKEAEDSLLSNLGSILPGRMLRLNDLAAARNIPATHLFTEGTWDPVAASALGIKGEYLDRNILFHQNRFYELDGDKLKEIEQLKDFTIRTSKFGTQAEIFKTAYGAASRSTDTGRFDGVKITSEKRYEEFGNNFDFFLGKDRDANMEAIRTTVHGKDRTAVRGMSRTDRFYGSTDRYVDASSMDAKAYKDFNAWYKNFQKTQTVNDSELSALFESLEKLSRAGSDKEIMNILAQTSSLQSTQGYYNPKLKRLISNYWKNPQKTLSQTITGADQYKLKDATAYTIKNFKTNLKEEMTREVFLRMESTVGSDAIQDMLNKTLYGERRKNMRNLAAMAIFEKRTGRNVEGIARETVTARTADEILNLADKNADAKRKKTNKLISDAFEDIYERFNFPGEAQRKAPGDEIFKSTANFHFVHKAYTPNKQFLSALNIIAQINENTKAKDAAKLLGKASIEFAKPFTQFISGNDTFNSFSTVSHFGYHIMKRVNDQLQHEFNIFGRSVNIDFRLQNKHQGSAAAIAANLVLRRVIPAGVILSYLDWMDDATKAITGTGLMEAGASGLANAYLGVKRITGAVGLDSSLKSLSSDNAILQYWSGMTGAEKAEWNTYEEEKDYYERGYSAIRKNRNWWFGSSNEYRGNKIAYFEPNTLRMLKSNYYMESMYEGSMWKKWSHSLLPTPTNPLSPLFYVADPYYLEEMHKEDRPYPITGSTFAENTPWGIILNPIADRFIKPKRQMYADRLGSSGVDVKALIAHVNSEIKRRANQNDDIIYLQNGKLRSMLFAAFNAPTPSERMISTQGASVTTATEHDQYSASGLSGDEYMDVKGIADGSTASGGIAVSSQHLTVPDRLVISAGKGNVVASRLIHTLKQSGAFGLLKGANEEIYQKASIKKDQGFFYENKMRYENSTIDEMLNNADTVAELMTAGKGHDYIHEMAVSTRNVTGLYGYLASTITGMGENNQKRIATSQNMESFSRKFWDLNIGALDLPGSEIMEIARRFIPNYQRQAMVNPLMNNMPDWLPERMRFGDPYASIPKGEARLPGRGYESLNQLHPDAFGRYGAFDRFKILADVAPYSPEYKFWKKVASATIQNPELKKEIQEVKERVAEQTKGHDFYNYNFVGRDVNYGKATVTEILSNGKFKINGTDQIYKLSGVRIKAGQNGESTQEILGKYIHVGQEVSLGIDNNQYYAQNNDKDRTINAAVMIDGESVAQQMIRSGDAKKRKGDLSASAYMPNHGFVVNTINTLAEVVGHADIPVFHSRFLKIETPLESYLDDNIYGTSYQSWSQPWETYIRPNFQKFASSPTWMGIGIAAEIIDNNLQHKGYRPNFLRNLAEEALGHEIKIGRKTRFASSLITSILNRGQLTGGLVTGGLMLGSGGIIRKISEGRQLGSIAALAYAAYDNPNNLAVSTMAWSRLGWKLAEMVAHPLRGKAAAFGAAIGFARWASNEKLLADDNANRYIPEETRKRWELQEYFDRLTYIKYMGLYEQAADKAMSEEGVNIRKIIAQQEEERKKYIEEKKDLQKQLEELGPRTDAEAVEAKKLIHKKLDEIAPDKIALRGGQWTKSAIMYKNAADATMYSLNENAVMADVVRALPKTERDYFIEFIQERDPEKREEILKTVSPLLNRALRIMWKMPVSSMESNESYFTHHTLPTPTWSGWNPHVDLANVEAKVIYNQGMQYSDMGIYASQYRTPEVQNAPNIEYSTESNNPLWTRVKLQMALTGTMLDADEISVEPKPDSGIEVIANVARIVPYKIQEEVYNLFSNF